MSAVPVEARQAGGMRMVRGKLEKEDSYWALLGPCAPDQLRKLVLCAQCVLEEQPCRKESIRWTM